MTPYKDHLFDVKWCLSVSWKSAEVFVESSLCRHLLSPKFMTCTSLQDRGWHSGQFEAYGEIALPWQRQDSVDVVHDFQVVICKWCSFWERVLKYRRFFFFLLVITVFCNEYVLNLHLEKWYLKIETYCVSPTKPTICKCTVWFFNAFILQLGIYR